MSDYQRVNNGVAFSTYEVFQSADANALRVNGELLWAAHSRSLVTQAFDGEAIIGATPTSGTLGPFFWSPYWNAYVAAALPRGSTNPGYAVFASPGGPVDYRPLPALFPGISTTGEPPLLTTVTDNVTGITRGIMVYTDSTAGNAGIAYSVDMASWLREYYASTSVAAQLSGGCPAVAVGSLGNRVLVPATVTAGYTALIRVTLSGGSLTYTLLTSATGDGAPTSLAVNTARNLAVACCSASLHAVTYNDDTGVATTYATPVYADVSSAASDRRIAYDPTLDRFVLMTVGRAVSAIGNGYLYWHLSTGTSWSATANWRRVFLGEQNVGTDPFTLMDFTITEDGVWLVVVLDLRQGSYELGVRRSLMSFDQGATWHDYGSWMRPTTTLALKLTRSGPGFLMAETRGSSSYTDYVSVSGAITAAATVNAETL